MYTVKKILHLVLTSSNFTSFWMLRGVILIGGICALTGGVVFYPSWQEKSAEVANAEADKGKEKAAAQIPKTSSGQTLSPLGKQAVEERTRTLIRLLDAFPDLYQARLLNLHKNVRRNSGTVTVDSLLEIVPDDHAIFLERFRKEFSGLGFSSKPIDGGNFTQILCNASESTSAVFYSSAQNLASQTLARYYEKQALFCRLDFLDKNGHITLSRTVSAGTPILFNGKALRLNPPQGNLLTRTVRSRFRLRGDAAQAEIDRVQLTLIYRESGSESMKENRESTQTNEKTGNFYFFSGRDLVSFRKKSYSPV